MVVPDDDYTSVHRVSRELVNPIDFEFTATLLFDQPRREWPRKGYIRSRTRDKESDLPFLGDVTQRIRIGGSEEQVVVAKQCVKQRKKCFSSSQVPFEKHGALRQRRVTVRALPGWREAFRS